MPEGTWKEDCHTGPYFKALAGLLALSPGRLWLCVTAAAALGAWLSSE